MFDVLDELEKARRNLTLAPSKADPTVRRWQNLQPEPGPDPARQLPDPEPGALRLYRAANAEGAGWTTSFASERENAKAYLDNPGFGGSRLFAVDVKIDDDEVLDLRTGRPPKWISGYYDQDGDWIDGVDDGRSLDVLFGELPSYVEKEVRKRGIKWVRVLDTYPDSSETWIAVDDSALNGAQWVELEKARRNLHHEAEEAGQVSMFLPPDPGLTLAPSVVDPTVRRWQNLQPDPEPEPDPDLPPAPPPDPDPFDADHLGVRDIFEGGPRMISNEDARRLREAYAKIASYVYDRVGRFAEAKGKDAQIVRALDGLALASTFLRLSGFVVGGVFGGDHPMTMALRDAFRADEAVVADAFKVRRPTDEGIYRKRDLSELGAALGAQFPVPTTVTVEIDRSRFGGEWGAGLVATWAPVNPGDTGEVKITVSGPTREKAMHGLMDRVERDLWRTAAMQAVGGRVSAYPPRLDGEERLAPEFVDDTPGAAERRRASLEIARLHKEYQADLMAYDAAKQRAEIDRYRSFREKVRAAVEGGELRTDTVKKLVNDLGKRGLDVVVGEDGPYWRRVYVRHPDAPSVRPEFSYKVSSETPGEDVLTAMRAWLATEQTDEELLAQADKQRDGTKTGILPKQTRRPLTHSGLTLPWLGYDREVHDAREVVARARRQEGLAKGSALSLGPAYADPSVRRWHNPGIQLVTSAGPHPDALQPVHAPSWGGSDVGSMPFAFWTSSAKFRGGGKATSAWREGLRDAREGVYSWILEPQGDPHVLTIRSPKDYARFMARYGVGADAVDWSSVRRQYDAVHYAPDQPFKHGVFRDWKTESTAWFYPDRDLLPMTKARLVIDLLELARRRNLYREAEEAGQAGLFDPRPEPTSPPAGREHLRLLPAKVDPTVRRWQDIRPEEVRTPPVSPELLRAVALHHPPPLVGGPVDLEIEDGPEPRPVWRAASEHEIPGALAVAAFEGTSHFAERRAESYRARYAIAVNEWAATYLARADKYEAEGNTEAADLIRDTLNQAKRAYRRAFLAYLSAHSRVTSWMITGPAGRNNAREAKRSDTADRRAQEADEILPAYSTYIARDLHKLAIKQAGGEVKYREALAARAARVRDAAAVREAMDRVVEAKAREAAQGTEGTFGPGGVAGVGGSWFVDEQGRLAIKFDERLPSNVYNEHMRGAWHYSRRTDNFTRKYTNAAVTDARKLTGDASIPWIDYRPAEEARKQVIEQRAEDRKVARGAARERSAADIPIEQDPDPAATLAAVMRKRSAFKLAGGEKATSAANERFLFGRALPDAGYRVSFEGRGRVHQGAGHHAWESPGVNVGVWYRGAEPRVEVRRIGYDAPVLRSAPIPPGSSMQDVGRLIASELGQLKAEDVFEPGSLKAYKRTTPDK